MADLTREQELEMWLRDARSLAEWLSYHVDWAKVSSLASREYGRYLVGIEKCLERNPEYMRGKEDRLAGLPATSKDPSYRMAYWNGKYPKGVELPKAVDACDWTEERKAQDERMMEKFRKNWGHLVEKKDG